MDLSQITEILGALPDLQFNQDLQDFAEIDSDEKTHQNLLQLVKQDLQNEADNWLVGAYAARILTFRRYTPLIDELIEGLFSCESDDDWILGEFPRYLAYFGKSAFPKIEDVCFRQSIHRADSYSHASLMETISTIVEQDPTSLSDASRIIAKALREYRTTPPTLNAFLILTACRIRDQSLSGLIQSAYEEDFVDQEIFSPKDIKRDFPEMMQVVADALKCSAYPSSYIGDQDYERLLHAAGVMGGVEAVKMTMLGAILAVEFVKPLYIFSVVFTDEDGEELSFETQGFARFALDQFTRLWNELTRYQTEYFPLPLQIEDMERQTGMNRDDRDFCSVRTMRLQVAIDYFLQGLADGNTDLNPKLPVEITSFIKGLQDFITHSREPFKRDDQAKARLQQDLDQLETFWQQNYLRFAKACLEYRMALIENIKFRHATQSVGRNDPCPCNSGKKFKKCCLSKLRPH